MGLPHGILSLPFLNRNGKDHPPAIVAPNGKEVHSDMVPFQMDENDNGTTTIRFAKHPSLTQIRTDARNVIKGLRDLKGMDFHPVIVSALGDFMAGHILAVVSTALEAKRAAEASLEPSKAKIQALESQVKYAKRDLEKALEREKASEKEHQDTKTEIRILREQYGIAKDRADSANLMLDHHKTNSEEARRERNRALETLRLTEEKYLEERKVNADLTGQIERLKAQLESKGRDFDTHNKTLQEIKTTWENYTGSHKSQELAELIGKMGTLASKAIR